jgi:hypothetical protein
MAGVMIPRSLFGGYQYFGVKECFHLQSINFSCVLYVL